MTSAPSRSRTLAQPFREGLVRGRTEPALKTEHGLFTFKLETLKHQQREPSNTWCHRLWSLAFFSFFLSFLSFFLFFLSFFAHRASKRSANGVLRPKTKNTLQVWLRRCALDFAGSFRPHLSSVDWFDSFQNLKSLGGGSTVVVHSSGLAWDACYN